MEDGISPNNLYLSPRTKKWSGLVSFGTGAINEIAGQLFVTRNDEMKASIVSARWVDEKNGRDPGADNRKAK